MSRWLIFFVRKKILAARTEAGGALFLTIGCQVYLISTFSSLPDKPSTVGSLTAAQSLPVSPLGNFPATHFTQTGPEPLVWNDQQSGQRERTELKGQRHFSKFACQTRRLKKRRQRGNQEETYPVNSWSQWKMFCTDVANHDNSVHAPQLWLMQLLKF